MIFTEFDGILCQKAIVIEIMALFAAVVFVASSRYSIILKRGLQVIVYEVVSPPIQLKEVG